MTQRRFVRGLPAGAFLAISALAVAACTSGSTPSAIASAVVNASLPPIPTAAPSTAATEAPSTAATEAPSESELPSAVPTAIDPCQVITSAEASQLVGVTFGAGKESETSGHVKMCTYAAPGPNLFSVEVGIAPDAATAQAAEAAAEQDLKDQASKLANVGLKVDLLPSFAPDTDAAMMQGSLSEGGISIAARAMYVLRNTTFFGFSDVAVGGGQPPSEQAMKDKATELLGKLP